LREDIFASILRQSPTGDALVAKKSPNLIDVHVGSRVRTQRRVLGLSQEKLGNALGLTFQQVQKYEKGTNRVGASRLQHLARILQAESKRQCSVIGLCV
jgi:ribosome-binding protein aMBF1 (putative translation factor)